MPTFAKARNLFRRRRTTVSSVDNVDSPPTTPVAPVGPPHLPRELAEEITGHLWNDRSTLRTLSLVSREFHRWSRTHLFTSVKFNLNQRFDSFLDLVESSEPTFGSLVRVLHLVALFSPRGVCRERTEESIRQLAAKLPNLKTVWLTSISWSSIPSHFLLLFIELKITHLQLESVIFYRPDQPKELFRWLPRSLEGITFDTIQFDGQRVEGSPDFYRDVHFRALDSTSLAIFRDVWDPAQRRDCKVTVKTLHMQLSALLWPVRREREIDFISQFLPQIGPSIRRLSIDLSSHSSQQGSLKISGVTAILTNHSEVLDIYETLDFSTCVNVNMIHIGVIELDKEEETRRVTATMWILLSSLPSPDQVDYIELTFAPRGEIGDTAATSLHGFPWLLAIMRLREMFRSLKRVTIRLGTWYNSGSRWTLQEAGLRTFEEVGFVKVENYRWPRSLNVEMPFYKLPWKESLNVF